MGRNSTQAMNWSEQAVELQAYRIPQQPTRERWPTVVLDKSLHVTHNFEAVELFQPNVKQLITASYEGLSTISRIAKDIHPITWETHRLGLGDQSQPEKNRGCSEVKLGRLKDNQPIIATIEPWHGSQVVLYEPVDGKLIKEWKRTVIDKDLKWGHALAWADLDGDGVQELIVGVRDTLNKENPNGVRLYRQQPDKSWKRQLLDPSGVAVEDLTVADLDGDSKPDIIAVGRATGNVRIYWNK